MPHFRCLICAENFTGTIGGVDRQIGFFATRYTAAVDASSAEALIRQRFEAEFVSLPFFPTEQSRLEIEEIEEIAPSDVPQVEPGFVLFPMEDTSH